MNRLSGKKLVVIRTGALGDVLMLLPFLQAVHSVQPECIHLVVEARQKTLLQGFRCVNQVFAADDLQWWRIYGDPPGSTPVQFLQNYDFVVAFIQDHGGDVSFRLAQLLPADVVVRPPFPHLQGRHVSQYYFETFSEKPPLPASGLPPWKGQEATQREAGRWLSADGRRAGPFWAIHPGSGSLAKNWPLTRFREEALWLKSRGITPVFILGPAEVTLAEDVQSLARELDAPCGDNFPLEFWAAVLTHCLGFLGNDSGITHLAALLGLPTVAVFVRSDPVQWRPLGPKVTVIDARVPNETDPAAAGAVRAALDHWRTVGLRV